MESRFPSCHLRRRQAGALLRFHVLARRWHELFIGMKELRAEELIHEYLVSNKRKIFVVHDARVKALDCASRKNDLPVWIIPSVVDVASSPGPSFKESRQAVHDVSSGQLAVMVP
ncbi:hypothetical protein MRX96_038781 [Rhipicephalus microplus]